MLIVTNSAAAELSCSALQLRYFDCYYCLLMKYFVTIFRSASAGDFDFNKDRMFDLSGLLLYLNLVRTNVNASILLSVTSSSFGSAKIRMFSLQFAAAFLKSARGQAC